MEQVGISERKAAALSGELEESKALMDSSERAKRQLEGAIHTIQAEVDAMLGAAKNAEEKSKKAMVDAARLADELRAEQDHASAQASSKQSLNNQFGQLEARLADAENAAARGGKAAMAKLENKVHELEAELALLTLRTLLLVEARPPWPSWRTRFTSWRQSLLELRHALVSQPRLTSALSARSRSSPSPPVRTRRTRTG